MTKFAVAPITAMPCLVLCIANLFGTACSDPATSGNGGRVAGDGNGFRAETPLPTPTADLEARLPTVAALIAQARSTGQLYLSVQGEVVANYAWGGHTVDTLVPWASASKPSTAVAFMQLVEEGRVALDDPVSVHVPGFEQGGKAAVLIWHLLTHTGHLSGYAGPTADIPWDEAIAGIVAAPLAWDKTVQPGLDQSVPPIPGEHPAYNPAGIWILGEILRIERAASFDRLIRSEMYVPAGMDSSFNGMTDDEITEYETRIDPRANNAKPTLQNTNPAGGTIGPSWELGRFYEMILLGRGSINGETIISPSTVADMTTIQAGPEHMYCWGYGFNLNRNTAGPARFGAAASAQSFGHNGASGMIAFADPEAGLVVALIGASADLIDAAYADLNLIDEPVGPDWTYAFVGSGPLPDAARGAACSASRCVVTGEVRAGQVHFGTHVAAITETTGYLWSIANDGTATAPLLLPGAIGVDIDMQSTGDAIFAGALATSLVTTTGTISADAGGRDATVVSVAADGTLLFGLAFGGAGNDAVNEVAVGADDQLLLIGPYGKDVTDASLTFPDDSTVAAFGGEDDVFVAQLSSTGEFEWGVGLDGDGHEEGRGVSVTPGGTVVICGEYDSSLTLGGTTHQTKGDADAFFAALDVSGNVIWSRSFGAAGFDACRGIDPGISGEVVISGEFTGQMTMDSHVLTAHDATDRDIFVARLSMTDGAVLAAISMGSTGNDVGCEIETDGNAEVWCAGTARGALDIPGGRLSSAAPGDQFLVHLSADLAQGLGAVSSTGAADEINFAIGLAPDGSGIVVGSFSGQTQFGTSILPPEGSSGGIDFYVAGFR